MGKWQCSLDWLRMFSDHDLTLQAQVDSSWTKSLCHCSSHFGKHSYDLDTTDLHCLSFSPSISSLHPRGHSFTLASTFALAVVRAWLSPKFFIQVLNLLISFQVYVNSFLATLNARSSIAHPIDKIDHMLISLSQSALSSTPQGQPNISIRIDTAREAVHERAATPMVWHLVLFSRYDCLML